MTFDAATLLKDSVIVLPEVLLYGFAFLILIVGAILPKESRGAVGWLAFFGTVLIVPTVLKYLDQLEGTPGGPVFFGDVAVDALAFFFKLIFLAGAALSILLSIRYLDVERIQAAEYYALIMAATASMMFMASSLSLLMIFISLETMALSIYILVGLQKDSRRSNEAALKYFVLGAFSSAIFVYGASLVYGATGSLQLATIASHAATQGADSGLAALGLILILVSLGFKMAAVPFHMYIPDAYEGAPTAITAFISTASKAAAFIVALRILITGFPGMFEWWAPLVALLAAASMTLGNVAAILQDNTKRMLAYSSIAHAGYALMGLLVAGLPGATGQFGLKAVAIYMAVYTFMNIGAFGLVILLRRENLVGDQLSDFSGLARRSPLAAVAMLLFLLSLAGIPPLAGFVGKWYLFGAAIKGDYTWLAVLAVVNSAVSVYYYLRVVVYMYLKEPTTEIPYAFSPGLNLAIAISAIMTVLLGIWPERLLKMATFSWSLVATGGPGG